MLDPPECFFRGLAQNPGEDVMIHGEGIIIFELAG